jgi:hypothetical protein
VDVETAGNLHKNTAQIPEQYYTAQLISVNKTAVFWNSQFTKSTDKGVT